MKITYKENPLETTVELDIHETKELWYKIKINEVERLLADSLRLLDCGEHFNLDDTKQLLDNARSLYDASDVGLKSKLDISCDTLLENCIEVLGSTHIGDCSCVPAFCSKCEAESLLGIDTIPGLGKYEASKIQDYFMQDNSRSLDDVIQLLANFDGAPQKPDRTDWESYGGFEYVINQWAYEAQCAINWLTEYKKRHLSQPINEVKEISQAKTKALK